MHIVLLCAASALIGTLAYVYVPTESIGAKSPLLATVVDYGTPVVVGAIIGSIGMLI